MASKRRGPQYMPVLASFIACNVHAWKTCVQITPMRTLLNTILPVTHVTLHKHKCISMPYMLNNKAALKPCLLQYRTISAAEEQRVLSPCKVQVCSLQLCSADK